MEIWRLNLRKGNFEELFEDGTFQNFIWKELEFWKFIWRWHFKNKIRNCGVFGKLNLKIWILES